MRATVLIVFALALGAQAQLQVVPLTAGYDAWNNQIGEQTMRFHHDIHYESAVNNTNRLIASTPSLEGMSLSELLMEIGANDSSLSDLSPANITTLRNQGGSVWNHALFWKILVPSTSPLARQTVISRKLRTAIIRDFGSVANMITQFSDAANRQFGSGWAWLCTNDAGKLAVLPTPNQDNPLMSVPTVSLQCTPILGLDVWEHAYYLKYGPRRADYVTAFWTIINWRKVSQNYDAALKGDLTSIAQ